MKTWEPVKARIYDLYIGQGLSLVQVREVLAKEEGFEACTRSYRAQISKWGWLKNNHQHLLHTGAGGHGATTPTARSGSTTPIKQEHQQHQQVLSAGLLQHHLQLPHHPLPHFGRQQQQDAYGIAALTGRREELEHGSTADEAEDHDRSLAAAMMAADCKSMNLGNFYMHHQQQAQHHDQHHQQQQRQQYHIHTGYPSQQQQQQQQQHQPQHHHQTHHHELHHRTSMPALQQRRESAVNMVILDNHGLNKFRGSFSAAGNSMVQLENNIHHGTYNNNNNASGTIPEDFEEDRKSIRHAQAITDSSLDSEEAEEEERRRYVKRQRHRSIIDIDGVHEIRYDTNDGDDSGASSRSASTSASSSPKSSGGAGADDDAGENIVMIDAAGVIDDDVEINRRNLDVDMEQEGDAARVLEEMKIATAGFHNTTGRKTFLKHGSFGRSQGDKYLHILNHKSPIPSPCPPQPHSPRLGTRSMISRVSTPFQRMSSPFIRAAGTGSQVSGYLEITESIPTPGVAQNLNAFSKITDWLLILTNGISRNMPLNVVRKAAAADAVKHLTITYHSKAPGGGEVSSTALAIPGSTSSGTGSIHLGMMPTIHAVDPSGRTPLHIAIRHRLPLEIIRILLELGAKVEAKDDQEINCLHEALQLTPPSTNSSSSGSRAEWTKSYLLPLIEELLRASSPPQSGSGSAHPLVNEPMAWSSDSPLHLALKHSQDISLIQYLIQNGAEVVNVLDVFGASPLHIACQHLCVPTTSTSSVASSADMPRKGAIISLLLEHGCAADINTKTADGHTPLHYAVKALCTPPPAVSAATPSHVPAYASGCYKDNLAVVEMLVSTGRADVSIRNVDGYCAQEIVSLALANRIENADAGGSASISATQCLSRAVKMLVKAEREAYLQKEEEMGGMMQSR